VTLTNIASKVLRALQYTLAVLILVFLALILAAKMGSPWRIGVDGQKLRCLPWSVFIIHRGAVESPLRGDLIQFMPDHVGHGFDGIPFVKMVGAVPGDQIEIRDDKLYINGVYRDRLWLIRALHKSPHDFDRRFMVAPGEILMLGTTPESFDGRYWGVITQKQVIGRAYPIF
jgi:conjugal transfer pilin signal peptidase TrbI